MNTLPESTEYDNCLDIAVRDTDKYNKTLAGFVNQETVILHDRKQKKSSSNYKEIYVHFRTVDDLADFCNRIEQTISFNMKQTYYPLINPDKSLDNEVQDFILDTSLLKPNKIKSNARKLTLFANDEDGEMNKWKEHWKEMPEFVQENNPSYKSVIVKFRKKEHYDDFANLIGQELTEKTKSIWHPELEIVQNRYYRWIEDGERTLPNHPMYIVSKGRHETMYTSRSLSRMQIPHYIIVEPQDEDNYYKAIDNFGLGNYAKLLIAPFSNHGDGPGRARNWAWDHSISIGATSHWVFDDNILDFYRLNRNMRIRFESGAGFRAMEDFVNRYENVYIAGPQYRFFIAPDQKYPPFVANTRVYSALLIRNDCKHRWRGRYNEDTDLCLRVMKDGDCVVQFNAFLQGKAATQTIGGGNTQEFYHAEGDLNTEKWRDNYLNAEGTVNKSQMLVDMHPDVASLVWKYGRWHHYVDYSPFKRNQLKFKSDVVLKNENNEYGMRLIDNYGLRYDE